MRNQLKNRIYDLLEQYPETRNCDATLVAKYWEKWEEQHLMWVHYSGQRVVIPLDKLHLVTPASAIERMRRKIQQEGRFWPTDKAVARRRRLNMEKWRDMMVALTPDTL